MRPTALDWLPANLAWAADFAKVAAAPVSMPALQALATAELTFLQTNRLGRFLENKVGAPPPGTAGKAVRLALLGSSTVDYLAPAIRVGALRRSMWVEVTGGLYGQYRQSLSAPDAALAAFMPDAVLLAIHAEDALGTNINLSASSTEASDTVDRAIDGLRRSWQDARTHFGARVIQQTFLPTALPLVGSNEHRLPGSPVRLIARLNERLRAAAETDDIDLLALDDAIQADGLGAWHDPSLWYHGKQQISPAAAPVYGDLVARLLAARSGRAAKCLVLDLDHTLWGGVIGDDGLDGIVLGEGSASGEAFGSFQRYVKSLAQRGIVLAVCSKNDEANAWLPFDAHPEMILKRSDIACLIANWEDKATNIRRISATLDLGLDALVFADDNPFERNIVRRELPMVAVPELPDDPARYAVTLSRGGYFDTTSVTAEDMARSAQYQANSQRRALLAATTDMASYLRSLEMQLHWKAFSSIGIKRIAQLINKSNQFNLTTRRRSAEEVTAIAADPTQLTLELRLTDNLGDAGIIGVLIAAPLPNDPATFHIDTWLMSCRVLGRQVEEATLNLLVARAAARGARALIGTFVPTPKNGMVSGHYQKLGFVPFGASNEGVTSWRLDIEAFAPLPTEIALTAA